MPVQNHPELLASSAADPLFGDKKRSKTGFKLFILAAAYICQTVPVGFCWVGLPVILRQAGAGLQCIGWLTMLYIPWALKFLWAPYVDRYYFPRIGHRRSWIFPLQWAAAALLGALALFPLTASPVIAFSLILGANFVYATNDIAVDGYAADILEDRERAWGNSVQMGGGFMGHMLGGGVFVMLHGHLGWGPTLGMMAALTVLLSLVFVFHKEIPAIGRQCQGGAVAKPHIPRLWPFLKAPGTRRIFLWIFLMSLVSHSGMYTRLPMLCDLGFTDSQVGSLLLRYALPFGFAGSVVSGFFITKLGHRPLIYVGGIAALSIAWLTVHIVTAQSPSILMIASMLAGEQMLIGTIQVLVYTMITAASAGPQSGTNYAVLCSGSHIIFFCLAPVMGALADAYGYALFYKALALGFVIFPVMADFVFVGLINKGKKDEQTACN